jgi:hypothetical protein
MSCGYSCSNASAGGPASCLRLLAPLCSHIIMSGPVHCAAVALLFARRRWQPLADVRLFAVYALAGEGWRQRLGGLSEAA